MHTVFVHTTFSVCIHGHLHTFSAMHCHIFWAVRGLSAQTWSNDEIYVMRPCRNYILYFALHLSTTKDFAAFFRLSILQLLCPLVKHKFG